jgi:hypothetical protein
MPALSVSRRPAWVWPASCSGALLALLLLLLVPAPWWRALWSLQSLRALPARERAADFVVLDVPPVRPPPPIAAAPDESDSPAALERLWQRDPDWWEAAWRGRLIVDQRPAPSVSDTLLPAPLLALLGSRAAVELVLAMPDSAVTARLWWLVQQERLTYNDLDGIFTAIARARAYADLKSREAAMYGEFMFETVPVTK